MKYLYLHFILLVIYCCPVSGQACDISALYKGQMDVNACTEIYADSSFLLTINDVQIIDFLPFEEAVTNTDFFIPNKPIRYWLKLKLENLSADSVLAIVFAGYFSEVVYYEETGSQWLPKPSQFVPKKQKPYRLSLCYAVNLAPLATKTLYASLEGKIVLDDFQLTAYSELELLKHPPFELQSPQSYLLFCAFSFGALVIMIIFSLIQYMQVRERAYLFYAFYLFFFFLYFLRRFEYLAPDTYIFFSYFNSMDFRLEIPIAVGIYISYILFTVEFLDIKRLNLKQYKLAISTVWVYASYIVINQLVYAFFGPEVSFQLYNIVRVGLLIYAFSFGYMILTNRTELSKYIILGSFVLLIGALISFGLSQNYDPTYVNSFWDIPIMYAQLGGLVELLFFSAGLGYKNRLEIKEKNLAALKAINAQMNPHFVFNCLNSIGNLIRKGETRSSINYLTKFAKLLRWVLSSTDKDLITLEEELNICQLYLKMEALRFKDDFDFKIDIENDIDVTTITIPPLAIQPYIENAIWHGLRHKADNRKLRVRVLKNTSLECIIEDNGVGREEAERLKGKTPLNKKNRSYGMELTRERLAYHDINIEIKDKFNANKRAAGTLVYIRFPKS